MFSSVFSDQSPFDFKVNDADVPDLFVFMADLFEGVMKNTTRLRGRLCLMMSPRGTNLPQMRTTAAGWREIHSEGLHRFGWGNTYGVTSYASSLAFGMYSDAFPPEAWDYIVDTFAIPDDADYTYNDVSRVRFRQETVVDADGNIVNENIYLQHDLTAPTM